MACLKFIAAVAAVAAVAASAAELSKDGYRFLQKEYELKTVTVTVIALNNEAALLAKAKNHGINTRGNLLYSGVKAFSVLRPASNECTIYVLDPSAKYEPEYYGHELAHCIWGRWHK